MSAAAAISAARKAGVRLELVGDNLRLKAATRPSNVVALLTNPDNPLPKVEPLSGSVHIGWRRCGRQNCRCASGHLHGPYYFRHWREGGRQRKVYVPVNLLEATLLAVEARRFLMPPASQIESSVRKQVERKATKRGLE